MVDPVQEYVYTPEELCRVMSHYGELVAAKLRDYPRFRLRARGLFTGRPLAAQEWAWNDRYRAYEPDGALWMDIPPQSEWPEELLRAHSVMSGKTGGKPCATCEYRKP
jgi:hypothetical protein